MKEKEVIYFRESLLQSILSDCFTFIFLVGTVWFNQKYVGGSYFINSVILVMLVLIIYNKADRKSKKFNSRKDLLEFLKNDPS